VIIVSPTNLGISRADGRANHRQTACHTAKSGPIKDAIASIRYLQELSPQPLEEYIPPRLVIEYVTPTMTDPRKKKKDDED
jgi:hypothetical protein